MLRSVLITIALIAGFSTSMVAAQTTQGLAIRPSAGLWWSPGANGQFLQLAIGPGGYALATLTFDDGDGPTYRVLQGQLRGLNPNSDQAIAELRSPLYRIDQSGCLDCTDNAGLTVVDDPQNYQLRFLSGTTAQLRIAGGGVRDYELFPLFTSSADLLAKRLAGRRGVLENNGASALVSFRPTSPSPDCGVQFSPSEQAYLVELQPGSVQSPALSQHLQGAVLVVDGGHNPRTRLLTRRDIVRFQCVPVFMGSACTAVSTGQSACVIAANLIESGTALVGPAETLSDPFSLAGTVLLSGQVRISVLD